MPRIRTLKPQFWDSPSTAKADLAPRLLFMALWNWADDSGRGTANLKEIEAFAFPNDDVTRLPRRSSRNSAAVWPNFAELFWETVQAYEVTLYEVGGRRFFEISSFRIHQSKHFKPDSSLPGPDDGQIWYLASEYGLNEPDPNPPPAEPRPDSSRNSALSRRNPPQDKDGDRDWDEDKEPPYPPDREPEPEPPITPRNDGRGKALARFDREANVTARSPKAHAIAQAFSDALPVPIESGVLADIGVAIDKCLRDAISPPAIANGIQEWARSDSWSPTQIPRFVAKAAAKSASRNGNHTGKPTEKALGYDQAADQLLAELGVPQ